MVEPDRQWCAGIVLGLAALTSGCALAPRSRLDECASKCQALQAETAQLKDAAARLRGQNRDLAQRAIDDARRLRTLEEANARLERSVAAYQDDVGRLGAAYDQIKRQVHASAVAPAAALRPTP
jgi:predicted nuclease with TOPRIM domain